METESDRARFTSISVPVGFHSTLSESEVLHSKLQFAEEENSREKEKDDL